MGIRVVLPLILVRGLTRKYSQHMSFRQRANNPQIFWVRFGVARNVLRITVQVAFVRAFCIISLVHSLWFVMPFSLFFGWNVFVSFACLGLLLMLGAIGMILHYGILYPVRDCVRWKNRWGLCYFGAAAFVSFALALFNQPACGLACYLCQRQFIISLVIMGLWTTSPYYYESGKALGAVPSWIPEDIATLMIASGEAIGYDVFVDK